MQIHLLSIGYVLLGLSFLHLIFPSYFRWKEELAALSLINRQIMGVHTFFIALTVLLMGLLCLFCHEDLTTTPFGRKIALGVALFWGCRLFVQLFVYSPRLWRGKPFETAVHILFTLFWLYITTVFFIIARGI